MLKTSNDETLDHLKVTQVPGYDLVAEMQRGDTDLKIRKRNGDTRIPSFRVNLCRQFTHFPGKRLYGHRGEDRSQVQLPLLRALGSVRPPKSMAELNHADSRDDDRSRFGGASNFPQKFADGLRATLGGDQHT